MKRFIFIAFGVVLFFIVLGFLRTWFLESKSQQRLFVSGKVPKVMPNGFYKGSVSVKTPWLGKTFERKSASGKNVFFWNGKRQERFSFNTYSGQGLKDKNLKVIKIDYSHSDTWWVRYVLDEIVEVAPGKLLGKAHIRIIPGLPFTIAYFELKK